MTSHRQHDHDPRGGPEQQAITRGDFLRRLAGVAVLAAGGGRFLGGDPHQHPRPRAGVTADRVLADADLPADDLEARRAYDAARAAPELFDGVRCVCSCPETMHHRSLLACFETLHPTSCPGCLDEAALIGRLIARREPLADVRRAVDRAFDK
ncbi:MAG TPA: hypothetical protein VFJ74_01480 [Gemmatimonadaceae bacterium]|nr:hypothetical protein [Gemmatimonadaceae bacterium]